MKEREKALADQEQGQLDHQSHDGSPPPIQTSLQPIMHPFDVNMEIINGEADTYQNLPSTVLPAWMLSGGSN
ncbi:unnamed protein product [Rhodiola kirilowii]